jgi:hypothetical protein
MTDLLARLEVAEAGSRELDAEICIALQYGGLNSEGGTNIRTDDEWEGDLLYEIGAEECCCPIPEVTTSLDAALALAKRVYPEGWLDLYIHGGKASAAQCFEGNRAYTATHASSPIAVCIAILKATHKAEGAEG